MGFLVSLLSFRGRITRARCWLNLTVITCPFVGVIATLAELTDPHTSLLPVVAAALVYLWPFLAAGTKRARDRDHSASWYFAMSMWSLIPVIGSIFQFWLLVELGFFDGTQGPNRFGPSPKGIGANQVVEIFS